MGIQIALQRRRIPLEDAGWFHRHCIHVRHNSSNEESRTHDLPGSKFTESPPFVRHPNLSMNDEGNAFDGFSVFH